jgi:cytochrome c-type biogenesis protein CcmH
MLWLILALLTIAAVAILIAPLLKGVSEPPSRVDYDVVVYRSQLKEIDQEIEQGLLTPTQGESARAEVQRRMLAAEDAERQTPGKSSAPSAERRRRFAAIAAIAVIVPVGAGVMYGFLGSPGLPGEPYAWRAAHDLDFVEASTADKLAQMLEANPSAIGYQRLGEMYFDARDYDKAADAYRKAVELGANDAWSESGEAVVMASGGAVGPEALSDFAKALAIDAHDNRAKFYVALAEAQIGNFRQAVAIWRDMEQGAPQDATWLEIVRQNIDQFSKAGGFDPATVPPAPPSLDTLNASNAAMLNAMHKMAGAAPPSGGGDDTQGSMPADGPQADMIHAMVDRLAARMQTTPGDVDGWQRLAHSYNVLGENDKARAAIDHAVKQKPKDVGVLLTLAEIERSAAPDNDTPPDYIATLRGVLKLDPDNVMALYNVGLAENKEGHADKARRMWRRVLSLASAGDPLAVKAQGQLDALSGKAR